MPNDSAQPFPTPIPLSQHFTKLFHLYPLFFHCILPGLNLLLTQPRSCHPNLVRSGWTTSLFFISAFFCVMTVFKAGALFLCFHFIPLNQRPLIIAFQEVVIRPSSRFLPDFYAYRAGTHFSSRRFTLIPQPVASIIQTISFF